MPTLNEVMASDVVTADVNDTIETLAKKMEEQDVGDLPVIENGKIVGVVTDRDIVIRGLARGAQSGKATAKEVMTDKIISADPEADVKEGVELMSRHQVKRLLVATDNELKGVVSIQDLAEDNRTKQIVDDVEAEIKRNGR